MDSQEKVVNYLETLRWVRIGPANTDLNENQTNYLLFIGAYGRSPEVQLSQKVIGRVFGDQPSSVASTLGRLVKEGYITMQESASARGGVATLTPMGERKYQGICAFLESNISSNPINRPGNSLDVAFLD